MLTCFPTSSLRCSLVPASFVYAVCDLGNDLCYCYQSPCLNCSFDLLEHHFFPILSTTWSGSIFSQFVSILQERSAAKHPRSRGWWLPWPCKGSVPGLLRRRRGLQKPSLRLRSTRNFSPPGSRSRGSVAARVWPREDPNFLLLLNPRLLPKAFCLIGVNVVWTCIPSLLFLCLGNFEHYLFSFIMICEILFLQGLMHLLFRVLDLNLFYSLNLLPSPIIH